MKEDKESEVLRSTGENGGKHGLSLIAPSISENFVFIFWACISLILVYLLDENKQWANHFSEINKIIQPMIFVFLKISTTQLFDSELANAHWLLMMLAIPVQIFMLLLVPNSKIASGVQRKSQRGLFWVIFIYSFSIIIVLAFGPIVPNRYSKILGENFVIAIVDYIICIGISYLTRVSIIVANNIYKDKKC